MHCLVTKVEHKSGRTEFNAFWDTQPVKTSLLLWLRTDCSVGPCGSERYGTNGYKDIVVHLTIELANGQNVGCYVYLTQSWKKLVCCYTVASEQRENGTLGSRCMCVRRFLQHIYATSCMCQRKGQTRLHTILVMSFWTRNSVVYCVFASP